MSDAVLSVRELKVHYSTQRGQVRAVDGVSFDVDAGESLGLVGESGCGKTTIALALLRVLPENGVIAGGQVILEGVDLVQLPEQQMEAHRGQKISMVFQAAMNCLDPVYRVGDQIVEAIQAHEDTAYGPAMARARELFGLVGLDEPLLQRYPHEYSGGMRQRAVIAMALACSPRVIIADEPTTALDVLVQDRILKELRRIQTERKMGMIYISHDIGVIAGMSDRVGVMYGGWLVELGPVAEVFANPRHPYTTALMASVPSVGGEKRPLRSLPGDPPDLVNAGAGCPFAPRCPIVTDICRKERPPADGAGGHWALCWHPVTGGL